MKLIRCLSKYFDIEERKVNEGLASWDIKLKFGLYFDVLTKQSVFLTEVVISKTFQALKIKLAEVHFFVEYKAHS